VLSLHLSRAVTPQVALLPRAIPPNPRAALHVELLHKTFSMRSQRLVPEALAE
jgi:hypothetical protein